MFGKKQTKPAQQYNDTILLSLRRYLNDGAYCGDTQCINALIALDNGNTQWAINEATKLGWQHTISGIASNRSINSNFGVKKS